MTKAGIKDIQETTEYVKYLNFGQSTNVIFKTFHTVFS